MADVTAATAAVAAAAACHAMGTCLPNGVAQRRLVSDLCSVTEDAALDSVLPCINKGIPLSVARTLVQLAIPFIICRIPAAFCTARMLAYTQLQYHQPDALLVRGRGFLPRRLKLRCYSELGFSIHPWPRRHLLCSPATQLINPNLPAHCTSLF